MQAHVHMYHVVIPFFKYLITVYCCYKLEGLKKLLAPNKIPAMKSSTTCVWLDVAQERIYMYVWQSRVEIEHYSVANFNCITENFKLRICVFQLHYCMRLKYVTE